MVEFNEDADWKAQRARICQTHCCKKHGCKYSRPDCPVMWGTLKQNYRCEYCDSYWEDRGSPKCCVLTYAAEGKMTCGKPGYWEWTGRHTKTTFSLEGVQVFYYLCDEHDELHRIASLSRQITSVPVDERVL